MRKSKHHHVTSIRAVRLDDLDVDDWQTDAVAELVDEDEITDVETRQHRSRRYAKRFDNERAKQENQQDDRKKRLGVLDQPRFLDADL